MCLAVLFFRITDKILSFDLYLLSILILVRLCLNLWCLLLSLFYLIWVILILQQTKWKWNHTIDTNTQIQQIKLRWALFVTYTIIQSVMRSEMCSLHLTHPSGAVGSRLCSARGAVGGSVPCLRVSPQSWTLPTRAGIWTHNLGLPRVSSPMLYPLGHDCRPTD